MAPETRNLWSHVRMCSVCGAAMALLGVVALALLFESELVDLQNPLSGQHLGFLASIILPACSATPASSSSSSALAASSLATSPVSDSLASGTSSSNASASPSGQGPHPDLQQSGQPRGYASVGTGKLTERDIVFGELTTIDLRYFQGMHCKGGNCPQFGSCSTGLPNTSTSIAACWNKEAVDEDEITTSIPQNYHGANASFDVQIGEAFAGQVFVLENVYINDRGSVFDRNHIYIHGLFCRSCPLDFGRYAVNHTTVHLFREMASIAYWNGGNFYHALLEAMPALLLLAPFLASRPGMPVAYRGLQEYFFDLFALIGLPPGQLNMQMIHDTELFFVERLLLPAQARCARPSRALIRRIRENFLKLPKRPPGSRIPSDSRGEQVPVANGSADSMPAGIATGPQGSSGSSEGANQTQAGGGAREGEGDVWIPDNWQIVIGQREKTRRLVGWEELLKKLLRLLPANRTQIFNGDLPLEEVQAMFSTTRIYIAPHGAALTNMVFMPWYGEVLEVRPIGFNNGVYHYVAHICGLKYNLLHGNGTKDTDIEIDHGLVLDTVEQILKGLPR